MFLSIIFTYAQHSKITFSCLVKRHGGYKNFIKLSSTLIKNPLFNYQAARQGKNNLNLNLFYQIQNEGKEIKSFFHKKRFVGAAVIIPLKKLIEKQIISPSEYSAGVNYCRDYELSNLTHHARPSYNSYGQKSNKPKELNITSEQINASRRVKEIKELILSKSLEQSRTETDVLQYLNIIKYVFEKQICVAVCEKLLESDRRSIHNRIKAILGIMNIYYN